MTFTCGLPGTKNQTEFLRLGCCSLQTTSDNIGANRSVPGLSITILVSQARRKRPRVIRRGDHPLVESTWIQNLDDISSVSSGLTVSLQPNVFATRIIPKASSKRAIGVSLLLRRSLSWCWEPSRLCNDTANYLMSFYYGCFLYILAPIDLPGVYTTRTIHPW